MQALSAALVVTVPEFTLKMGILTFLSTGARGKEQTQVLGYCEIQNGLLGVYIHIHTYTLYIYIEKRIS